MAFASSQMAFRPRTLKTCRNTPRASRRPVVVVRAGLFDFLFPKTVAKENPRVAELVDELLAISEPTDAGLKASPETKANIKSLIEELEQYCIKNPVKSDLLWGEYQVVYTTQPKTLGGPLREQQVLFPGQRLTQILEVPNSLINVVEFQTLGFLPGYAKQYGELQQTSPNTFKVDLTRAEGFYGLGPVQTKEQEIERGFRVVFLDERVRVMQRTEITEGTDNEEPITTVFKRLGLEADLGEEEPEEEPKQPAPPAFELPGTQFLFKSKQLVGTATMTERAVRRQMEQDNLRNGGAAKAGTKEVGRNKKAATTSGSSTRVVDTKSKDAEKAQKEKEAAAAREKQNDIKDLLVQLQSDLKAKAAEAKEALQQLRAVERSNGAVLKAAAQARAKVEASEAESRDTEAELAEAAEQQKEAVQGLREAEAKLKEVEKKALAAQK